MNYFQETLANNDPSIRKKNKNSNVKKQNGKKKH